MTARKKPAKRIPKPIDLHVLCLEAGKRGEGWCACKWRWGDDLVGHLVSECAYHADLRNPPVQEPPLMCVDCKWFNPALPPLSQHKCELPARPRGLVDGEPEHVYASVNRGYQFLCGKSARWFEPIPAPAPSAEEVAEVAAPTPEPPPKLGLLDRLIVWLDRRAA